MDGHGFDELVRQLGAGRSRRAFLRGLLGGSAAFAVAATGTTLAAKTEKISLCHRRGDGSFGLITVSGNAAGAHLVHGDGYLGSDQHCSACGDACTGADICVDGACQCQADSPEVTCAGKCGPQINNCGDQEICEACSCLPDAPEVTCAGKCGPQVNNCMEEVPCDPCPCDPGYAPIDDGCGACPKGYVSPYGISCSPCAMGTYAEASATAICSACPAGTFSDVLGAVVCNACPAGKFSDVLGAVVCSACPVGTYASASGSVACVTCGCSGTCDPVTGVCDGSGSGGCRMSGDEGSKQC